MLFRSASASSALEEKEINAKKAELKRIIETVSEKLEKTYELQKAVWIGLSEAAGGLSRVKKVSDDIIEWMGKNKKGINTKPLKDFSDSLKVIIIIEELEYLALILKIPPPIIDRALEEIKSAKDKSQNMEKLKKLAYEIETIMQEAKEKLEEISVSLGISSPISEEIQKLLTELEQEIADFSHYALAEPPKSNQEVPILDAKLGKIQNITERIRNELWYFFGPEIFLADQSIELGIDFALINDAFNKKSREAIAKGVTEISDSCQFILKTKISIAGITYDSF